MENIKEIIKCEYCGTEIKTKSKMTALGFHSYICPTCKKQTLYPLSQSYKTIYWIIIGVSALGVIYALSNGEIIIPGIVCIAAIVGLVKDNKLRKKLNPEEGNSTQ